MLLSSTVILLQFAIVFCRLRDDFAEAMDGVMSLLKRESHPNKLVYIGELLHGQTFSPKMVQLTLS